MGATSDLFGIGTSALVSYQRVLATTSHNFSNVQNEDYSRQSVALVTNPAQRSGAGFIGSGIHSNTTSRQYDQFLTTAVRDNLTERAEQDIFLNYSSQVDDLLANPDAGLMPAVESFFNAVHDVANDPTSTSTRSVLLAEGESLADRFKYMSQRIHEINQSVTRQIDQVVSEINALAHNVAELNAEIQHQTGSAGGQPPNDLLDQRDAALSDLAERINITAVPLSDGSLNVFVGNGQNLVVGNDVLELNVTGNVYDRSIQEITYQGSTVPITDFMKGGTLGGLLEVRDDVLLHSRSELGRIAITLAETFNEQHNQGMDINGGMGLDFFHGMAAATAFTAGAQVLPDQVFNDIATDVAGTVEFTDVGALRATEYQLDFDGVSYQLRRLSDNAVIPPTNAIPPGATPNEVLEYDTEGFSVTLTGTSIAAGDSFVIRPTYNGAQDITMRITDPAEIAAAAPIRIDSATDIDNGTGTTGVPVNTGTGVITPGIVTNATGATLSAAEPTGSFTLVYDSGVPGFVVSPGHPVDGLPLVETFPYDPVANNGDSYTLNVPGFGDITFNLSGIPADGDAFVIRDNALDNDGAVRPGGVGDARNAALLASLQNQNLMSGSGGYTDYQGAYGNLVADVGIRTNQAEVNLSAREKLLEQARAERDEVSGVNLDEEAANLIRYQQAYQAAAQVLSVGRDVFQTLLSATNR